MIAIQKTLRFVEWFAARPRGGSTLELALELAEQVRVNGRDTLRDLVEKRTRQLARRAVKTLREEGVIITAGQWCGETGKGVRYRMNPDWVERNFTNRHAPAVAAASANQADDDAGDRAS